MREKMDLVAEALHLGLDLWAAEEAMQTHKAEIDAFMQDVDAPMSDEAQAAFEEWALARQNINRAFRRIEIEHPQDWCSKDYMLAAEDLLKRLTPLA